MVKQQKGPPGGPGTSCRTRDKKIGMVIDQRVSFSPQVWGQLEKDEISICYVHVLPVSIPSFRSCEEQNLFLMVSIRMSLVYIQFIDLFDGNCWEILSQHCCIRALCALYTRRRGFKGIRSQYSFNMGRKKHFQTLPDLSHQYHF